MTLLKRHYRNIFLMAKKSSSFYKDYIDDRRYSDYRPGKKDVVRDETRRREKRAKNQLRAKNFDISQLEDAD